MKKVVKIEGMSCHNCVRHTKEALEELTGVNSVEVSLEDKQAVLEVNDVTDEEIISVVSEVGYKVVSIS